jgi:hypothetical protein
MKVCTVLPENDVLIYRVPDKKKTYRIFITKVVEVEGEIEQIGPKRYRTPNKDYFQNINTAGAYLLREQGHTAEADELDPPNTVRLAGVDLVARGYWPMFCEMRGINPRDIDQIQRDHDLRPSELVALKARKVNNEAVNVQGDGNISSGQHGQAVD